MSGAEKPRPAFYSGFAGTLAGAAATIILHPLDLVKTRFQVQDGLPESVKRTLPQYRGTIHAFTTIVKTEGPLGLYQGLAPNLIGASVAWGGYFWAYNFFKTQLLESDYNQGQKQLSAGLHLLAGTEAGVVTAVLTNPIWVIKTRVQLQFRNQEGNYRGVIDAFRTILREEGVKGLYKGLLPGLFGVSHGALQFMSYEEIKKYLVKLHDNDPSKLNSFHWLMMGGVSKVFAAVSTYPYQVVRSRLQERPVDNKHKYNGATDIIRKIIKYEGVRGFYKGLVPNLLRVTPAAAITFVVYENIMKWLPS